MKQNQKNKSYMIGLLVWLTAVQTGWSFYNAQTGRWLSRDPVGEPGFQLLQRAGAMVQPAGHVPQSGGQRIKRDLSTGAGQSENSNVYAYVGNSPAIKVDFLGLLKFDGCTATEQAELTAQFNQYCQQIAQTGFKCCANHFNIPQRLAGLCGNQADITIKCIHSYGENCDRGTCSWTLPGSDTIRMCPDGLAKSGLCSDPYGCQIMHEMTHMIGHPFEKWPQQVGRCLGCQHWQ